MSEEVNPNWVEELINGMEGEFDPSVKLRVDGLANGFYTFKVNEVETATIESSGDPLVRWQLEALEGPTAEGAIVEKTSFMSNPKALSILGAELVILGSLSKDWKTQPGTLGAKMQKALAVSVGKVFRAKKDTNVSPKNGKTYHNLSVLSVVEPAGAVAEGMPF
jgi:hypothetical protein